MKPITTKTTIKKLCCLLLVVLSLGACKKDAMQVKAEKHFELIRSQPPTDLADGGVSLTLRPNGTATVNPGGDIVWSGTYDISGDKITVKVQQTDSKYKFTIVSDEEIHDQFGQILKLVKN